MKKLSAAIITCNEADKIARALSSVAELCDEIVVVDSGSTDQTLEICKKYTARVVVRDWPGYRAQKQFATEATLHRWVLSLDSDEEVSAELASELLRWKESEEVQKAGYRIPRMAFFMGRWIRHTTWYPDWQLRLFDKTRGCWEGGRVHESFRIEGEVGRMQGHILHYTYSRVDEYLAQLDRFSTLVAHDYLEQGRRAGFTQLALHPPVVFFKNYVAYQGFRDGVPGLAVSVMAAASTFFKYLKLWELRNCSRRESQ